MAIQIQIHRSGVSGTTMPSSLAAGELAVTYGDGTSGNAGGRLFIGDHNGGNVLTIGGQYTYEMLDHAHGTLAASSAVIVDGSKKIDIFNVDNLTLDGNTLST